MAAAGALGNLSSDGGTILGAAARGRLGGDPSDGGAVLGTAIVGGSCSDGGLIVGAAVDDDGDLDWRATIGGGDIRSL